MRAFLMVVATWSSLGWAVEPAEVSQADAPVADAKSGLVKFVSADDSDEYDVFVKDLACRTPCTLELEPTRQRVRAIGPGVVTGALTVPRGRSTLLLQSGSAVVPLGIVMSVVGFSATLIGGGFMSSRVIELAQGAQLVEWGTPLVFLLPGLAVGVPGLVMAILGKKRVWEHSVGW